MFLARALGSAVSISLPIHSLGVKSQRPKLLSSSRKLANDTCICALGYARTVASTSGISSRSIRCCASLDALCQTPPSAHRKSSSVWGRLPAHAQMAHFNSPQCCCRYQRPGPSATMRAVRYGIRLPFRVGLPYRYPCSAICAAATSRMIAATPATPRPRRCIGGQRSRSSRPSRMHTPAASIRCVECAAIAHQAIADTAQRSRAESVSRANTSR